MPLTRVRVAFLWHMHQPSYRDPLNGAVALPWVRLHALKDYLGMVEVLRETPEVHVTFNLVPSLLDQLETYARGEAREGLLALSLRAAGDLDEAERAALLRDAFLAHPHNLIGRFPRFAELRTRRDDGVGFSVPELRDLQVLSKLAWFDLGWQQEDPVVRELVAKGRDYGEEDKAALAERERALLAAVVPAYRQAAQEGRVELSTSPYYHPILPLLCDSEAHHEAHPAAPLPRRFRHPEDAADQIRRARERHARAFGAPPAGLWPSEGSVSEQAVTEMARAGVRWTATDEGVLSRSLGRSLHRDSRGTAYPLELLYRPWVRHTDAGPITLLFRDRTLSDLIGFSYSSLEPERAAADMLARLRRVGERWKAEKLTGIPLVAVILDGENCWEHYADGGREFLRALYGALASDPHFEAVSVSEAIADSEAAELPRVFAGSWIHADFSVWIGHADDRSAWDLLGDARDALEQAAPSLAPAARERAWEVYRAACGSDWCWWYGEEHSSANDLEFDHLYRRHLRAIYEILGRPAPAALDQTLITARRLEVKQSRPAAGLAPVLDGRVTTPDEWVAAGMHRVAEATAMHRGLPALRAIHFGRGDDVLHLMLEAERPARELLRSADVAISFPGPTTLRYRVAAPAGRASVGRAERTGMGWVGSRTDARVAADEVLELSIPLAELRPGPGSVEFRVLVLQGDAEVARHPEAGPLELVLEEVTRD